jgi:hypothetical protein
MDVGNGGLVGNKGRPVEEIGVVGRRQEPLLIQKSFPDPAAYPCTRVLF